MQKGKGAKIILAASLVSIGSFSYIPSTYAATMDQTAVPTNSLEQNPNTLSGLEIVGVPLDQTFSPSLKEYSATVENNIPEINLVVKSENPEAILTVNGQPFQDGLYTIHTGMNTFEIAVKDGSHTVNTYKLTLIRKQNNNNLLKNIKLSKGELSPKFDSSIVNYSIKVDNNVKTLTVIPESMKKTSSIQIKNKLFKGERDTVSLPEGKSTITILVTAENGEMKTYTLHVTRELKQASKPPVPPARTVKVANNSKVSGSNRGMNQIQKTIPTKNVTPVSTQNNRSTSQIQATVQKINKATLSSLTVSTGIWNKDFITDEYTYHLSVASDVKSLTIKPTVKYSNSTVKIEGGSSQNIKLDGKKTIISVVVSNGEDRKTYVLIFRKKVEKSTSSSTNNDTVDSTVNSEASRQVTNSNNNLTTVKTSAWQGQGNPQSLSFWGRITENISKFFSKLF
ncbi:cadherin-like beta sandwich domain-containing protein [Bacillus sp. UNC438CL73TsuS30]|uniref:cadherin-like beta sandwich domain-containing protein n=1 Tax=Bacillus sp. UNC438CL73TsuS30 TaxID=1340434 RepID=UPI00047CB958|nr:cadherin-like beta sandwich domain-containing protein [Bacillus sp. UNC438CL73TsuS30]